MIREKLYLNEHEDVWVSEESSSKLMQFQRDGIRFLYRHYKKGKPGVIVNDTECPERTVQLILFLWAIKHTLKKPALLLCNYINEMKILFHDWTEHLNDVSFESKIQTIDKKIYVNSLDNITALCLHEWSVLVVFEEEYNIKLLKQLKTLKVMFKIAVVSVDLKTNLTTFMSIYEWIYPNERAKMELLLSKAKKIRSLIEKAIYVDSLFETVALKRNLGKNIEQCRNKEVISEKASAPLLKVSRKNKDATGTKTKRTKKKDKQHAPADILTEDIDAYVVDVHDEKHIKNLTESKEKHIAKSKKSKFTLDSDEKDILEKNLERKASLCIENYTNTNSLIENKTDISDKMDLPNNYNLENSVVGKNSYVNSNNTAEIYSFVDNRDVEDNDSSESNETSRYKHKTENNEIINVYKESKHKNCMDDQNIVTEGINQTTTSVNEHVLSSHVDEDDTMNLKYSDEISIDKIESNYSTKEKELNECDLNEKKEDVCNEIIMTEFDTKIKILEEKTNEKFKGSFLDSIF